LCGELGTGREDRPLPDGLVFTDLVGLMVGAACAATPITFLPIGVPLGQRPEDLIDALLDGPLAGEVVVGQGGDDVGVAERLLPGCSLGRALLEGADLRLQALQGREIGSGFCWHRAILRPQRARGVARLAWIMHRE
jgi:hypothetical protein